MALNKRLIGAGAAGSAFVNNENFRTVIYDGNGSTNNIVCGFQPDWVWIKERGPLAEQSNIYDSTRGVQKFIVSNSSAAEVTGSSGRLNAFNSDGFTVGSDNEINDTGSTYVAWCWKAGEGTTSSNTDGNITSTVQANTDAGFSIITYTGTGGGSKTIGHGLGVEPSMYMTKRLNHPDAWRITAKVIEGFELDLSASSARFQDGAYPDYATSSVIKLGTGSAVNTSGGTYVTYCFANITGYQKIGLYTGTGAEGNLIETGFEPAFIMVKRTNGSGGWLMFDNKRNTSNPRNSRLEANNNQAEQAGSSSKFVDFLSNGFEPQVSDSEINASGDTYLYWAIATNPSTETPSLASSFNIETWTGTGVDNETISGLGFKPNMVWYKTRNQSNDHNISDSIRGAQKQIRPNRNISEVSATDQIKSFDTDGFTLGTGGDANASGDTYVAWSWKANDEITLFGGDAAAVYKFEDNYNDVTGTYNGSNTSGTSFISGGKFNKAVAFSGTSSNMDTGITARNFESWSFWFKPGSSNTGYRVLVCTNSSGDVGQNFEYSGSNSFYIVDILGGATNNNTSVTVNLRDGNWHHIVLTKTATKFTAYLNKQEQISVTNATGSSLQSGNEWSFGKGNYGNANSDFAIDQARYFESVLEQEDIDTLYDETAPDNNDLNYGSPKQTKVSVNSAAGFSIAEKAFAGKGTIAHGLSQAPNMVIKRGVDTTEDWYIYHSSLGTGKYLSFNRNGGTDSATTRADSFSSVTATSVTDDVTSANVKYIMYSFHDVAGYQKFGSYTGTGSAGHAITVGFKPDFVLLKSTTSSENWSIFDSRRGEDVRLFANTNDDDEPNTSFAFSSTGFVLPQFGSMNGSGETFIYWAIATNVPSSNILSDSFGISLYTGNGASRKVQSLTFKPDIVWIKDIGRTREHILSDSVRGTGREISPNTADAEETDRGVGSFNADGFSLSDANTNYNENNQSYVAWSWKAGNQWQSNTDGSINSVVSANTGNGLSIIKYTGTGSNETVGHGLSGSPEFVIVKNLSSSSAWAVYHTSIGATKYLALNESTAESTASNVWNDTSPSSTTISIGTWGPVNTNGDEHIMYAWDSVTGFSKFGTYTGNGSTQSITGLGFRPDWILIKQTNASNAWRIFDSMRGLQSPQTLFANLDSQEDSESNTLTSFDSDGWTMGSQQGVNDNGDTYIYAAYKMNPTVNTTLANSFKTVIWTGTGSTQQITGLGFKPDLVWLKQRGGNTWHNIQDSINGPLHHLYTNANNALDRTGNGLTSFDTDGFTLGGGNGFNGNNQSMVAWAWKAGNAYESNIDGTIPSIVNANTANGFSVVKYTATGSTATVGHGLSSAPELIIAKTTNQAYDWLVYHASLGNDKAVSIHTSDAAATNSFMNNTSPTSTVFTAKSGNNLNYADGNEIIAYCWHSVSGYSKIGSYTGTGSSQTITTGFAPDFIITKRTETSDNWRMYDYVREDSQPFDAVLYPNLSDGEDDNTTGITGRTDTGFTLGTGNLSNSNGGSYIYIAFKMN